MTINFFVGVILAIGIAVLTRIKKALTWGAVWMAGGMLIFISCMSGWVESLFLVGMYLSVFVVDAVLGEKMESATKDVHEKGGIRNYKQILANGSVGCICILLYKMRGQSAFLMAYYASIFEVMADSIASDVGVLSKHPPRDICTWKVVKRGISGGVSVLGLMASAIACVVAGMVTGLILKFGMREFILIIIAPYFGMLADSVIGSRLQVKYVCTVCGMPTEKNKHCGMQTVISGGFKKISNSMVNFICTVLAAVTTCLLAFL